MSFGSFGTATPSTTFGGFGSTASAPQSTSTFGSQTSSTFGQSLFGSTPSSGVGTGGGFSFASTPGFGGGSSAFGAGTGSTYGGFGSAGATQPQQPTSSFGFGSTFPSTSTFGGGQSTFGSFGAQPQAQQQQQTQPQPQQSSAEQSAAAALVRSMAELKASYDPTSPLCRFQAVFYNRVADPSKLKSFVPPPHANPALYARAVKSNPDPSSLTPSLAVGFDDLRRRLEAQREARGVHEAAVKGIRESVEEMRSVHWAYTVPVLRGLRDVGEEQSLRLARVVNRIISLDAGGVPLLDEERAFRARLEHIAVELQREGFMERAKETQRRVRMVAQSSADGVDGVDLALSAEDREKLRAIIDTQTKALDFLVDVVKEDRKLLNTIAGREPDANAASTALRSADR